MKRLSSPWLVIGLIISISGAGCRSHSSAASATTASAPIKVTSQIVEDASIPDFLLLSGSLVANEEATIAAGVSGKVIGVFVERGSQVKKGDLLVQLDNRAASAAVSEAQAQLNLSQAQRELADRECDRDRNLQQLGAISDAEWQRREAQCKVANASATAVEARLRMAQVQANDAAIRAPFGGVVAERMVSLGEYVRPETQIATLVAAAPLRLELTVPEASASQISKGMQIDYWLASDPHKVFTTNVKFVSSLVRKSSRDMVIEAVIPKPDAALRPGMFVQARVHLGERTLPVVPKTALLNMGEEYRIFVVDDGKLHERLVQIGPEVGEQVSILSALKKGERVVSQVTQEMRDGLSVSVE